jgi:phage terminase small subunit
MTKRKPIKRNSAAVARWGIKPPSRLSDGGRKVWDTLVSQLNKSGRRLVCDQFQLANLCEDEADLIHLREDLARLQKQITVESKERGLKLAGGPLAHLLTSSSGKRMMSAVRALQESLIIQRRELCLTPASDPSNKPLVIQFQFPPMSQQKIKALISYCHGLKHAVPKPPKVPK